MSLRWHRDDSDVLDYGHFLGSFNGSGDLGTRGNNGQLGLARSFGPNHVSASPSLFAIASRQQGDGLSAQREDAWCAGGLVVKGECPHSHALFRVGRSNQVDVRKCSVKSCECDGLMGRSCKQGGKVSNLYGAVREMR
jgi:hypothetical protein